MRNALKNVCEKTTSDGLYRYRFCEGSIPGTFTVTGEFFSASAPGAAADVFVMSDLSVTDAEAFALCRKLAESETMPFMLPEIVE